MKEDNYIVSILVPIYGVEKYIERCAVTLFEQTYENIEYIFVDDCTKDNSINILKKVIQMYPKRQSSITIITHEKNKGLGGARNTAIENAKGEFVIWVDSDDYVDREMVDKAVKKQQETGADIVTFDAKKIKQNYSEEMIDSEYNTVKEHTLAIIKRSAQVRIWGRLVRLSLYLNNDIRVLEGVNMGEDYQVSTRLVYFAKKTSVLHECLYFYDCTNEGSYSNMFSLTKNNQSWMSFDVVKQFFVSKGEDYENAIYIAELTIIVSHLIISQKINADYYYNNSAKRLVLIDKKYWLYKALPQRIILYLYKYRFLMNVYIGISRTINQNRLFIKSHKLL